MKIDYLLKLRNECKKGYIDAEKALKLEKAYNDFSNNSLLLKFFYFIFYNSDYKELYEEYKNFSKHIDLWNNSYSKLKTNSLAEFFNSLGDIKLNEQQQNIITAKEKTLMVLAGAGSGKTLTIAAKVKYLVDICKINPEKILLLAFTRKSAGEITERIKTKFKVNLSASTFHSLGYKIIYETEGTKPQVPDNPENIFFNFFENYANKVKIISDTIKEFSDLNEKAIKNKSKWLSNLVFTFINLLRSRNAKISDIKKQFSKDSDFSQRDKLFLCIAEEAQNYYENELKRLSLTDFNDMINRSSEYVEQQKWQSPYSYVIIDEYQDISFSRYRLIHAIVKASNASLMCIGDDWQSIYRFTGSDVDLITNFQKYWGVFRKMKIEKNYRNTQENIDYSAGFVLKNPRQLAKKLISNKHSKTPFKAIKYGSPSNGQAANPNEALIKAINDIAKENDSKDTSVLLLGRNNADILSIIPKDENNNPIKHRKTNDESIVIHDAFPNIKMRFLTVHKAKGLEADYVVIINMKSGMLGFPNKISDDKVMRFVLAEPDNYEYAEERRLFYVAITRARKTTYLLVPDIHESIFAKELLNVCN